MCSHPIPPATLGRLPQYLQYLKKMPCENGSKISAAAIARGLLLGEVQVRKDLAMVSGAGKPKIGYERCELVEDLERCLGYNKLTNAVLIGTGKLGKALLDHEGFEEFGVQIIAGFDCNEETLEQKTGVKSIFSVDKLSEYCVQNDVEIGIITVGQSSAQDVCDILVASGIKAIWNFAPCALTVPREVLLKQENLALSVAYLKNRLIKQPIGEHQNET